MILRNAHPASLLSLCIALSFVLSACSTVPPPQATKIEANAAFKEIALWKEVRPATTKPQDVPDQWWTLFNDTTLNDLQAQVLVSNETLKNNLAQIAIAQAALNVSQAALLPTVGSSTSVTRSRASNPSNAPIANPTNSAVLQLTASWEADLWGRLGGAVDNTQARYQASRADLAAAHLSIASTLAQTYFAARAAQEQVAVLTTTVKAYERSLQLTRNRYTAGVVSAADVAQAVTQLKSTEVQRLESRTTAAQLEHAIAVLVGKAPADFSLADGKLPTALPIVPEFFPATVLTRRPDIAAAQLRVAAANAQIGVASAAFFPALTFNGSGGYRGPRLADFLSAPALFWSLGPALALTVFDGGARQANINSAGGSAAQAAAVYRQAVLVAFQEVEDNLVLGANLRTELGLQQEALVAAKRSLEITENQYQAGTVAYTNVVAAQITALASERSLLDIRNRELAALNILLKNIAGRFEVKA